jgi:hypothetical protein
MASNRSFKDYVADRFYNEVFAAIQSYTTDNYDDLDLRLYRVRNIGGIELYNEPRKQDRQNGQNKLECSYG